jgi:hypothetical protein
MNLSVGVDTDLAVRVSLERATSPARLNVMLHIKPRSNPQ